MTAAGPFKKSDDHIHYCYDQVQCTVSGFPGIVLRPGVRMAVVLLSSNCDSFINVVTGFPNSGVSLVYDAPQGFRFGAAVIEVPITPLFYTLCFYYAVEGLGAPAGTLRVGSFEEYYRTFVEPNIKWSQYEPGWKMWLMAFHLPLGIIMSLIGSKIYQSIYGWNATSTPTEWNTVARMKTDPIDPDAERRLFLIHNIDMITVAGIRKILNTR